MTSHPIRGYCVGCGVALRSWHARRCLACYRTSVRVPAIARRQALAEVERREALDRAALQSLALSALHASLTLASACWACEAVYRRATPGQVFCPMCAWRLDNLTARIAAACGADERAAGAAA